MAGKCFVVMGFGEKTDLATGRTLDLDKTYRIIIKKVVEEAGLFKEAKAESDWSAAAKYLKRLLERRPSDDYLRQQLALATYKSKKPDVGSALAAAKGLLEELHPHVTTDPETLGLWGAFTNGCGKSGTDERIWTKRSGRTKRASISRTITTTASISPSSSTYEPRHRPRVKPLRTWSSLSAVAFQRLADSSMTASVDSLTVPAIARSPIGATKPSARGM